MTVLKGGGGGGGQTRCIMGDVKMANRKVPANKAKTQVRQVSITCAVLAYTS